MRSAFAAIEMIVEINGSPGALSTPHQLTPGCLMKELLGAAPQFAVRIGDVRYWSEE